MPTDNSSAGISLEIIQPDWPVPTHVHALSTTRLGGISKGDYCSNNLALHVGDVEADVLKNRATLCEKYALPSEPSWLNQTHSTTVVNAARKIADADASYTSEPGIVSVVMTADCLPLLLSDKAGTQVAAVHAGWRGLVEGIIEETVNHFSVKRADIVAWLGPAIGPKAFEVGSDVRDAFIEKDLDALQAFRQCSDDKWLANIYELARQRLKSLGIEHISGGDHCTFSEEANFFSYRRDKTCGRMASLIWLDK